MRISIVLVAVVALVGCTPANSPEAKNLSYVEAVALEGTARQATWPAYANCKQRPHPAGCDGILELLLDTLFRARTALSHWAESAGTAGHYGCLMTEAQTYLAQLDQASPAVLKLDPFGRPCPR